MRFSGQDSELQVGFDPFGKDLSIDDLNARFLAAYEDMFGYVSSDGVESVNLRLRAYWPVSTQEDPTPAISAKADASPLSRRPVYFEAGSQPILTPVYDRQTVAGPVIGPAIFESADTTFTIPPGATAEPDPHGNLVVTFRD
jgi:N-methylhydantoinase A